MTITSANYRCWNKTCHNQPCSPQSGNKKYKCPRVKSSTSADEEGTWGSISCCCCEVAGRLRGLTSDCSHIQSLTFTRQNRRPSTSLHLWCFHLLVRCNFSTAVSWRIQPDNVWFERESACKRSWMLRIKANSHDYNADLCTKVKILHT